MRLFRIKKHIYLEEGLELELANEYPNSKFSEFIRKDRNPNTKHVIKFEDLEEIKEEE